MIIPFALYACYLFPYFIKSGDEKRAYLNDFELARIDDFGFLNQVTNFIHLLFAIFSIYTYHRFIIKLKDNYSEIEKVQMAWLKRFLYFVLVVIIISIFVFYSRKYQISFFQYLYPYHFLGLVSLLYWIGYKSLVHPPIFHFKKAEKENISIGAKTTVYVLDEKTDNEEHLKYQKSGLSEPQQDEMLEILFKFMKEEKPFLNENLSIIELSGLVNI